MDTLNIRRNADGTTTFRFTSEYAHFEVNVSNEKLLDIYREIGDALSKSFENSAYRNSCGNEWHDE